MRKALFFFMVLFISYSCNQTREMEKMNRIMNVAFDNSDSLFMNLGVSYREEIPSETADAVYFVHFNNSNNIVVHPHTYKQSLAYFLSNNSLSNVSKFMEMRYGTKHDVVDSFVVVSKSFLTYLARLGQVELVSDTAKLGSFIIYNISQDIDLVHVWDNERIYSESWTKFFKENEPYEPGWYIKVK